MTRQVARAALLAFATLAASCDAPEPPRVSLEYHVGGRTAQQTRDGRVAHVYTWPGVYFEARFEGPTVGVEIDDPYNALNLYVDDSLRLTLPRAGRQSVVLTDLGEGEHTVRLEKTSETQGPAGAFLGFFVRSAGRERPPPVYERAIEYIGDSFTVGYGVASTGRECTTEQVFDTTDTSLSFAPKVARHFGADYRVLAASGFGMVRNYSNMLPGTTMPVLYDRTLFDGEAMVAEDGWQPDVFVIGLGTNDFSTPVGADEKWQDSDELHADYRRAYVAFVERLDRQSQPLHFVLLAYGEFAADVAEVRDELLRRDIGNVTVLSGGESDLMGCHHHPSRRDHEQAAALLIGELSRLGVFGH